MVNDFSREILYSSLVSLGNYYALDTFLDCNNVGDALKKYEGDWKHYNPRKPHVQRHGLSLTSLDGGLSGVPDLDSLKEFNHERGTSYGEKDFRQPTPVLLDNEAIRKPIEKFLPHLGRSHFLRLGTGGYFPFHRDSVYLNADTFRLISLLPGCESGQFCFLYDRQRIFLEVGQIYFLNTKVEHALFSFGNAAVLMVLNVILSEESVRTVMGSLLAR